MKILSLSVALLSLAVAAPAFADSTTGDTDAASPAASPVDPTGMAPASDLKALLTKLVKANQGEIDMGKLAATNAKSKLVKDFAKKLVADHTAAAKKVEPIATAKGVDTTMSAEVSDDMSKMQALKGSEFDREFASMMIDGHQQALSLLDQIKTAAAGDTQVDKMVDQLKPTFKMHLASAKALAKTVGSPRHETRGTDSDKDKDNDNDTH